MLADRLSRALDRVRLDHPDVLALGAPQIGSAVRMCVACLPGSLEPTVLINPWVAEASLENVDGWECCASFPELRFGIRRFARVTIEYVDLTGIGKTLTAEGEAAALLQHEIDHFNGFLVTDRLNDPRMVSHRRPSRPFTLEGNA